MVRKNLLAGLTADLSVSQGAAARTDYIRRGASRSMMATIEDLAETARRVTDGDTVVSVDPALVEPSFVSDRLELTDDEAYLALREAIREQGQAQPALLRPHPREAGRYMVVFGHRRWRAARDLGMPLRAVIREVDETAHVILQGQENSARANLTFIERAAFAAKLVGMGHSRATAMQALATDEAGLSRLITVAETVPPAVLAAIGPARGVGRDRWDELKKYLLTAEAKAAAEHAVTAADFGGLDGAGRFERVLEAAKAAGRTRRPKQSVSRSASSWAPRDGRVEASYGQAGRTFTLALKAQQGRAFGQYLVANLDRLYEAFLTEDGKGE